MKKNRIYKNFIFLIILLCVIAIIKNDIFSAVGAQGDVDYSRYYYAQLSDEAKLIYDGIINSIEDTKGGTHTIEISINTSQFNNLKNNGNEIVQSAMDAFDRDHPEVFWLDVTKLQVKFKSNKIMLTPLGDNGDYLISDYENQEESDLVSDDWNTMEGIINNIISYTDNMTDYEKIKYIHDYLVINNEYNQEPLEASAKAYKSISALIGNSNNEYAPLCEGYARAFKVLCDRLSIPCVIVSGESIIGNEHLGHMWNYVMVDKKWFAIDVTWDDPVLISGSYDDLPEEKKYEYFLIGEEKELTTHVPQGVFTETSGYDFAFQYPLLYPLNYGDDTVLYSINITKYSNGVISTNLKNNEYVKAGSTVSISIDIKEGMKLIEGSLKVNGKAIKDMQFVMPQENVTITAAFITESYIEPDDNEDDKKTDVEDNDKEDENDENDENDNITTKEPENEENNNEDNDQNDKEENDSTKPPINTKKPIIEDDEITQETKPVVKPDNSQPPQNSDKEENKVTSKPVTSKVPKPLDKTEKPDNKDEEQSQVIIIEDNFETVNPLENIKIINKAVISMSNKEVRYNYIPELSNKKITFYIANMGQSQESIIDIISKDYLIKNGSTLETLQIIVYDNETSDYSKIINKNTPLTVFIPVDSSWVSKDYEKYFYLIENGIATKKVVMVRESNGQYYLQIELDKPLTSYAILRRRADDYVIPGTVSNEMTGINSNDGTSHKEILGVRELVLIVLSLIAIIMTFKVISMQHKAAKIEDNK